MGTLERLEIVDPTQIIAALKCLRAARYEVDLVFAAGCEMRHLGCQRLRPYGHIAIFPEDVTATDWRIDAQRRELHSPKAFARMIWKAETRRNRRIPIEQPWGWLPGRTLVYLVCARSTPADGA